MKRFWISVVIASIVAFQWGFVFWTVLPFPNQVMKRLPSADQERILQTLKETLKSPGMYFYPMPPEEQGISGGEGEKEFAALYEKGPILQLSFQPGGAPAMDPKVLIQGFIMFFIATTVGAWILYNGLSPDASFGKRFQVVMLLGLVTALTADLPAAIWFMSPWDYQGLLAIYHIVQWILVGLVLAIGIKPKARPVQA